MSAPPPPPPPPRRLRYHPPPPAHKARVATAYRTSPPNLSNTNSPSRSSISSSSSHWLSSERKVPPPPPPPPPPRYVHVTDLPSTVSVSMPPPPPPRSESRYASGHTRNEVSMHSQPRSSMPVPSSSIVTSGSPISTFRRPQSGITYAKTNGITYSNKRNYLSVNPHHHHKSKYFSFSCSHLFI